MTQVLYLDADLENADWPKRTDDRWLPEVTDENVSLKKAFSVASIIFTRAADCGANAAGGGGFQPGNTCGGDKSESTGATTLKTDDDDRAWVQRFNDSRGGFMTGAIMAQHEKDRIATGRTKKYPVWSQATGKDIDENLFQFEIDVLEKEKAEKNAHKEEAKSRREKANSGMSDEWNKDLKSEERLALDTFFHRGYEWMRNVQRGGGDQERRGDNKVPTQEQERIVEKFERALDKAPKYDGTIYRAISHDELNVRDYLKDWKVGVDISMTADSSATANLAIAERFLTEQRTGSVDPDNFDWIPPHIMLVVKSRTAADVRAANPGESEVILRKGTWYKITKIENWGSGDRSGDGSPIVHMEEI